MQRAFASSGGPDDLLVVGNVTYVALISAGKIVAVAADGSAKTVASGLSSPEGTAPAGTGAIYVIEQTRNRLVRVALDSGAITPVHTFPNPTGKEGIDGIHGEAGGKILVPDSPGARLLEYDPATDGVRVIATGLGRPVDAIEYQGGFAVADEQRGVLQVSAAGAVQALSPNFEADDLALAPDGSLLATDLSSTNLWRVGQGVFERRATGFKEAQGLAFDADGSLLVADETLGAVFRLPAACVPH